jgi:hypothetical protein
MFFKVLKESALHRGIRVIDVPVRQLFKYDEDGEVVPATYSDGVPIDENRLLIARKLLEFSIDDVHGVSLRQSLANDQADPNRKPYGMIKYAGCKVLVAFTLNGDDVDLLGFLLYYNVKDVNLEIWVRQTLERQEFRQMYETEKGIVIELIASRGNLRLGDLLLLSMIKKLTGSVTYLVARATNNRAKRLFTHHGYWNFSATGPQTKILKREYLFQNVNGENRTLLEKYMEFIARSATIMTLCTRSGASPSTRNKKMWDCN